MNGPIKNLLVGIFILGAISIFVGIVMFLKPTIGDGKQTLYVRFSDIGSLNVGTRVLFAGKPVGEVVAMEEIHDAREQPTDELGRVYFYQLTLHIDSSVRVYNTDEVSTQSAGFLGEKSIAIVPKAPPKGVTPKQITNQPIYADSVDALQNAMLDFSELAASMEETFRGVNSWIRNHGEEVATTIRAGGAALEEIDQTFANVNKSNLVHEAKHGICEVSSTLGKIQVALTELESQHTFKNAGCVMESLKSVCHSADVVANDLAQGKGTLGKLIVDNGLYLQANAIMTKANTLMNDVNQYGILFHLNKHWQRTHLQRISKLNALETPQSFRIYFQREVEEINASMTRISMLLHKAEQSTEKEKILESQQFRRNFADLLKKADELSDNLRLYNQQLTEAIGN